MPGDYAFHMTLGSLAAVDRVLTISVGSDY
jgi:hypothetical protein